MTDTMKSVKPASMPEAAIPDLESNPQLQHAVQQPYLNQTLSTSTLVPALMIQAFATGILDATTYLDFRTFASNRTPYLYPRD
jgi:hypothetical protein